MEMVKLWDKVAWHLDQIQQEFFGKKARLAPWMEEGA